MNPQAEAARQAGVRMITVINQRLRVAIRPGNGSRTPLLLMNGVGVNLELLQHVGSRRRGDRRIGCTPHRRRRHQLPRTRL
jgi:hypothetical protein